MKEKSCTAALSPDHVLWQFWETLCYPRKKILVNLEVCRSEYGAHRYAHTRALRMEVGGPKLAFDWTVQTLGLLSHLNCVLSNTIEEWNSFSIAGGDLSYFRDTKIARISRRAHRSLRAIKATFGQLQRLQKKVDLLKEHCVQYKGNVSKGIISLHRRISRGRLNEQLY